MTATADQGLAPVLVDAAAIAADLGMAASTVRGWAHARLITARGRDNRGRTLYDLDEATRVSESGGAGRNAGRPVRSETPRSSTTRVPRPRS
jgi:hypothetical protein